MQSLSTAFSNHCEPCSSYLSPRVGLGMRTKLRSTFSLSEDVNSFENVAASQPRSQTLSSLPRAISSPEFSGSAVVGSPGRPRGTRKKYEFFLLVLSKTIVGRKPVVPEIFQKRYLFSLAVAYKRKSTETKGEREMFWR